MTAPVASEAQYTRTIIDACRVGNWLVHHCRPGRTARGWRTPIAGTAGFCDLVIVGHGRLLVLELKVGRNKPTAEQTRWLDELRRAGVDARLVHLPDQLDALVDELVAPIRHTDKENYP